MSELLDVVRSTFSDAYEIEEEIGRGGMASVFRARDRRHPRQVAVKVFRSDLDLSSGLARFQREIEIAAGLQHPNILTLYDSGERNGLRYYVMPFVVGRTLRDRLNDEPRLPVREALSIGMEIASALSYAHEQGVIHRDIKPGNVLLSSGHAIVADFGIARALASAEGEALLDVTDPSRSTDPGDEGEALGRNLTMAGSTLGSVNYMSPEQASGESVDARTDVYALGCVLYEMLTGNPPNKASSAYAVLARALAGKPDSIRSVRDDVPASLAAAIDRALRPDPEDRQESAVELLEELEHVQRELLGTGRGRGRVTAAAAVAALAAGVVLALQFGPGRGGASVGDASLGSLVLVMPFDNVGEAGDEHFAVGVVDEISSRLGQIPELGVMGRESAGRALRDSLTMDEVESQLGADFVLSGSVRWQPGADGGGRVRVTPRLQRTSDGAQVWSRSYNAELSDIFAIQDSIAVEVTQSLGATLFNTDSDEVTDTENMAAYTAFLRAGVASRRGINLSDDLLEAIELYSEATELDPEYAPPYWGLVDAYGLLQFNWPYLVPDSRARAAEALARAAEIAPEHPQTYLARGLYYYRAEADYDLALDALETARTLAPGDFDVVRTLGLVYRRRGDWQPAISSLEAALRLDPLEWAVAYELGRLYTWTRDYAAAERYLSIATSIQPETGAGYRKHLNTLLLAGADWSRVEALIAEAAAAAEPHWLMAFDPGVTTRISMLADRFPDAFVAGPRGVPEIEGREDGILALVSALAAERSGRADDARRGFAETVEALGPLVADPEGSVGLTIIATLAMAHAALGERDEALSLIERVESSPTISSDAMGTAPLVTVARTYVRLGMLDDAVAILQRQLRSPALVSVELLRAEPEWRPLRGQPAFEALLGS